MNPRPTNAAVVPAAIALATRARMNSIRRRCSSRDTSQKLDADQHHDRDQRRHRLEQLAAQRRDVDDERREHEQDRGRDERGADAQRERALVVRRAAGGERAEQDRDAAAPPRRPRGTGSRTRSRTRRAARRRPCARARGRRRRAPRARSRCRSGPCRREAPSRMSLRSFAYLNSVSSTRFGLRRRSGISTNSKWSRYAVARERVGALVAVAGLERVERLAEQHARLGRSPARPRASDASPPAPKRGRGEARSAATVSRAARARRIATGASAPRSRGRP